MIRGNHKLAPGPPWLDGESPLSPGAGPRVGELETLASRRYESAEQRDFPTGSEPMSTHPTQVHLREADRTLELEWTDGAKTLFSLRYLRGWCPCAHCQGHFAKEMRFQDVPDPMLETVEPVGGYAMKPRWTDGHQSGIYSYEYLRQLAVEAPGDGPSNESCLGD